MSNFKIKIDDRVITTKFCKNIPEGLTGTILNDIYCFCVRMDDDNYNLYEKYPDEHGNLVKGLNMSFCHEEELELIKH